MPMTTCLQNQINEYMHVLPDEEWYSKHFYPFLTKSDHSKVSGIFHSARMTYKFFEGMHVTGFALEMESRVQVIEYVSVIEFAVDWFLKTKCQNTKQFQKLIKVKSQSKPLSLSSELQQSIRDELHYHQEDQFEVVKLSPSERPWEKIRFENKISALVELKVFPQDFGKELKKLYTYRNMVHIEAELRHSDQPYNLDLAEQAERHCEGVSTYMESYLNGTEGQFDSKE